jgi:hypothetical protein
MNIVCNINSGGAIFSKLMLAFQGVLLNTPQVQNIEHIRINISDRRFNMYNDMFDNIFIQNKHIKEIFVRCDGRESYAKEIPLNDLTFFKILKDKFIINDILKDKFNELKPMFTDNYLGVHIRLTDMNKWHPEHGIFNLSDFINKIDIELNEHEYDKIFIASDNHESLFKLRKIYGDKIIYNADSIRSEKETDGVLTDFTNKKYWEDSFLDMLLLSECKTLIHRVSNVANFSKIYSKIINL